MMRKRVIAGMTALLLFSFPSQTTAQEIPAEAIAAFKKGSSAELGRCMGDKVSLVFPGRSASVNRQNATAMMQNFFAANKVGGFDVTHRGKRDESSFFVGTLATANGKFRVSCFLRKVQNKCLIHQIRFEKINE